MGTINKPNIVMPLAASYNQRGVDGVNASRTLGIDQRKVNCFYQTTKNSVTGSGSLNLVKRPGVSGTSPQWGASNQLAFAISEPPGNLSINTVPWVFSTFGFVSGTGVNVSDAVSTVSIVSLTPDYIPAFIDKTLISNTENLVLQCIGTTSPRTFYTTSLHGWTEILDVDFTSNAAFMIGKIEHMDGYAFQMLNNNKIINSDLNSLANWTSTSFTTKQIQQDSPKGLAKCQEKILAFGDYTCEVFYNSGTATGSPLSSIKQLHARIGLAATPAVPARPYYCTIGREIYFLGRSSGGSNSLSLYNFNGSSFTKIKNEALDRQLEQFGGGGSSIYSVGINGLDAVAINLTTPAVTTQQWLMWIPSHNDFFEWNSTTFQVINNGNYFLGTGSNANNIYTFDTTDNWQDQGTNFTSFIQFKLPGNTPDLKRMGMYGVTGDTARSSNVLSVEFSDDDYVTFINAGSIDLASKKKVLYRGGAFRDRAVRLSSTNSLEFRLQNFIANVK